VVLVKLISMFTEEDLEGIFCGEAEVDLTILRKATIYESLSIHETGKLRGECPSLLVLVVVVFTNDFN
jgi:hypothetical protein